MRTVYTLVTSMVGPKRKAFARQAHIEIGTTCNRQVFPEIDLLSRHINELPNTVKFQVLATLLDIWHEGSPDLINDTFGRFHVPPQKTLILRVEDGNVVIRPPLPFPPETHPDPNSPIATVRGKGAPDYVKGLLEHLGKKNE